MPLCALTLPRRNWYKTRICDVGPFAGAVIAICHLLIAHIITTITQGTTIMAKDKIRKKRSANKSKEIDPPKRKKKPTIAVKKSGDEKVVVAEVGDGSSDKKSTEGLPKRKKKSTKAVKSGDEKAVVTEVGDAKGISLDKKTTEGLPKSKNKSTKAAKHGEEKAAVTEVGDAKLTTDFTPFKRKKKSTKVAKHVDEKAAVTGAGDTKLMGVSSDKKTTVDKSKKTKTSKKTLVRHEDASKTSATRTSLSPPSRPKQSVKAGKNKSSPGASKSVSKPSPSNPKKSVKTSQSASPKNSKLSSKIKGQKTAFPSSPSRMGSPGIKSKNSQRKTNEEKASVDSSSQIKPQSPISEASGLSFSVEPFLSMLCSQDTTTSPPKKFKFKQTSVPYKPTPPPVDLYFRGLGRSVRSGIPSGLPSGI